VSNPVFDRSEERVVLQHQKVGREDLWPILRRRRVDAADMLLQMLADQLISMI
jgi:hypothetical protein